MELLLYPQHAGTASSDLRPVSQEDLRRIPPWYGMTGGAISGPALSAAEDRYSKQNPDAYAYWKRVKQLQLEGRKIAPAQDLTRLSANLEFVRADGVQLTGARQWIGLLVSPIGLLSYVWAQDSDWWAHTLVFGFMLIGLSITVTGWWKDRDTARTLVAQENEDRLLALINRSTQAISRIRE